MSISKVVYTSGKKLRHFQKQFTLLDQSIDEKDKERERARLSRDGEVRTPPPTPSRDGEERAPPAPAPGGGWGAPFAVTAEPRSLSLFIFFVDVKSRSVNYF